MKDCFLKLHKLDKSTMDKIVSLALADHDWNNFADTYSSFDENGVRKSPRYVSTISQGIFDTWNENMQFISDLILNKLTLIYGIDISSAYFIYNSFLFHI